MKQQRVSGLWPTPYGLAFLAFFCNVGSIVFGYLNASNAGGLFYNKIGNLSAKYFNEVAPAGIIFGIIWPIIYLWTLAGSVYIVVSLFLSANQSPVNTSPTLVPRSYLFWYCIGYGSTIGWLFAFDRELLILSFFLLLIGMLSVYMVIGISLVRVYDNLAKLQMNSRVMLWLVRMLIQNGLCVLATWLTLATLIGLSMVLLYEDSFGQETATLRGLLTVEDASSLVLGLLFFAIMGWFIIENVLYQQYCRYVIMVYPVFILAFSGLIAKLLPLEAKRNLVLVYIELAICVLALGIRILVAIYRWDTTSSGGMCGRSRIKRRLLVNKK